MTSLQPGPGASVRRRWPVRVASLVVMAAAGLLAAACGSSGPAASASIGGSTTTTVPFQGAIGQVASLSAPSMEVQNPQSGQSTVSWTSSTTFTQTVTESLSNVAVGDCVTATGTPESPGDATGAVAARSVSIFTPQSDGSCTQPNPNGGQRTGPGGGFGGGGRNPGSGSFPVGSVPSGTLPQIANVVGTVLSVSSSGFVVHGTERSGFNFRRRSSSGSSTTTTTTPSTADITVTTTSTTTVIQQKAATASALAVGECVTARGPADSTGAVTATAIAISQPTNGQCFGGFGARGAGGGFFGGAGSANG